MNLRGATCLVTRAAGQAGSIVAAFAARGALVVEAPVIAFEEPASWSPADAAITALDSYDKVVFTSANAVRRFFDRMERVGRRPAILAGDRCAAIGPATASALEDRGVKAADRAQDSRAEGLVATLLAGASGARGARILIPRAEVAREVLPDALRRAGAEVDVVPVYRTVAVPLEDSTLRLLREGRVHVCTFLSGSTVGNFLASVRAGGGDPERFLRDVVIAVIGPVTAQACREAGVKVDVIAPRADARSLVDAIESYPEGPAGDARTG